MKKIIVAVILIALFGVFSSLSAEVVVPNVIGMDLNKAAQELQKAGLKPGNIAYVNAPKQELNNKVAGQIPGVGAKLSSPQPVNLTVYRLQVESVTIPNVVGMGYIQALQTFNAAGLASRRRDKETNDSRENEKVFGQGIAAGQKVPKGTVIDLIVHKFATPPVTVPDVAKMSLGEAQVKLLESGLTTQAVPQATPTSDPKLNGKVSSQNPQAGNRVPKGSVVKLTLFVSQVVQPPSATVAVPEVIRMSIPEATAKLSAAGLKPEVVPPQTTTSDPNLNSKISYQNPRSGTQVPRGSVIKCNLFVYLPDDMVTVPSFVGLSPAKASDLVIGILQIRWGAMGADVHKNGKIASHNPPAGARVKKTSVVQITAMQQVALPNVIGLSLDAALQKLRAAGLDGKVVAYVINSAKPEGTIKDAFVGASGTVGSKVDIGSVVSLQPYRRK
jgi:beta-lactam-binding protein with PASTA domain